ncbi:MAG: hypothetical protein IJW26_01275, partial [Clostridia bacterium]|nr:hypothetical protein [Clostridia bacterium]
ITLTVKVDGRYVNDFSDSSSVMAAYRVDYLKGDDNGAGGTYGSSDLSHKASYTADDIAPNTTWVAEHEGRYGVIKTQPQGDHTPQYNSGALQSRLGIHLRSADYRTYAAMNAAGVTRVVYDQDTTPSTNQNYLAYNCANWDYISVPVYFPAPEGKTSADTIKVGIMYASQLFDVPYNTWYELQLDKPRMTLSYGSPDLLKQFIGDVNGGVTALFFLAQNDETAAANLNQEVYIDSVSFEKYEGYEAFESLNFYNVTDNEVAPTVYEFAHYTTDGSTYVALEEKDFVLQAKVDGKDIAVTDLTLRYQTWANNMQMTYYAPGEVISNEDGYYLDDDAKLSGRGNSGYVSNNNGLYRIHVSAVTSAAGAIATNRVSYYCFGYDYTDPETNKKYRGYTMLACKPTIVDAPTA